MFGRMMSLLSRAWQPASGVLLRASDGTIMFAWGASAPSSAAGYAKGCLFIVPGTATYKNTGTSTTSIFLALQ